MKPRFIFVIGKPKGRKATVALNLADYVGLPCISLTRLIASELATSTPEAEALQRHVAEKTPISKKLRVSLLSRAISQAPGGCVITGFLKNLKEALFFERAVGEISLVVILTNKDGPHNPPADPSRDTLAKYREVFAFYRRFGLLRFIDSTGHIDVVTQRARSKSQLELYIVIGGPASGKTSAANYIAVKYNMTYIDVARLQGPDPVESALRIIQKLHVTHDPRVILDNFPASLAQLKFFEQAYALPKLVIGLVASTEEVGMRRANIQGKVQAYKQKSKPLWDFLATTGYFKLVHSLSVAADCYKAIDSLMAAEIVLVRGRSTQRFSDVLSKAGYEPIDIDSIIRAICERMTPLGRKIIADIEQGKIISTALRVEVLRQIVYNSGRFSVKFQMASNFPQRKAQVEQICENVAQISRVYYCADSANQFLVEDLKSVNILTVFQERLLLQRVFEPEAENLNMNWLRTMRQRLAKKGKCIMIFGAQLSGKTTVAKALKDLGWEIIDYESLPEAVKARKSTDEEPYEDVDWQDIIDEVAYRLSLPGAKIVLDGPPPISLFVEEEPPVAAADSDSEAEIKVKDPMKEFFDKITSNLLKALGEPYTIFSLKPSKDTLVARLRNSLQLTSDEDEIPEDAFSALENSILQCNMFDKWFAENFSGPSYITDNPLRDVDNWKLRDYYKLPANTSENFAKLFVKQVLANKVILVAGNISNLQQIYLTNICVNYDLLHLHLPKVLNWAQTNVPELAQLSSELLDLDAKVLALVRYAEANLNPRQQVLIVTGLAADMAEDAFPRPIDIFLALEQSLGTIVGDL